MTHDFVHPSTDHIHSDIPKASRGSSGDFSPRSRDSNVHCYTMPNVNVRSVNNADHIVDDAIVLGGGKSIKQKCSKRSLNSLSDDPCDFPDDNEVMVSMLETIWLYER